MGNAQITNTAIGREFQWDRLSDVQLDVLESSRIAAINILNNPSQFPLADFDKAAKRVRDIDAFMQDFGDALVEFV